MLEHGGRLRQAASRYGIPLSDWLDLSTGINPNGWPVPPIPAACWQRLPEEDDGLLAAAHAYYQNSCLLPVAGSQAAIQTLPRLRSACRVGVLHPAYAEHAAGWQKAGHRLRIVEAETLDLQLGALDVLVIINPNNPTGRLWAPEQLLAWHAQLSNRGGWLIVDEAFMDGMPTHSLTNLPVRPGLIVLRSIGKFFGLAGIRCGFVVAEQSLLAQLAEILGPWTISHPGRFVAAQALADRDWQQRTAADLQQQGRRLRQLLTDSDWQPQGGCHLFQWLKTPDAAELHALLAEQGILTRLFHSPTSLRFGLPGSETGWQRLSAALSDPAIRQFNNPAMASA
ncbi:threonine-phosphate decarboxylase CobD [Methylomonas methanica]|uniref:threonine-phosphate decarboxylase n=1 Tax=Methylomonas methanica (strain DSM 25384 / MC09) TaxID=857087 RepID=G0A0M0_METMM|nr:threonine-phosphate decarboxylase CobD [Methylomonas methanica]AEF98796.1 L-threonine-O-3-phosphate decarboxylase [Methylomonas methanica MC09]